MEFLGFEPIFGEPMIEWPIQCSNPLHKFVLYVHTPEPSRLRILVTDFLSNTWEASRTVHQLDDMRDNIGIGGSWSDFVDYVRASMKSTDVKLVVESSSSSSGARLVAQKSKGMPRISIPLVKLVDAAATDVIATISLGLFETFKSTQNLLVQEQESSNRLKKALSDQKEKNESIQIQLEMYSKRQKLQVMSSSDTTDGSVPPGNGLQNSPDKPMGRTNRVVPAHRRARVRGVLLQNSEDDNDD